MKCEIEIDGLPEGYRVVRYGKPLRGELFFDGYSEISEACCDFSGSLFIVEKIKPRRRVFECVSEIQREPEYGEYFEIPGSGIVECKVHHYGTDRVIFKEITDET